MQYFFNRVDEIKPAWGRLQALCRAARVEVMYTVIQSATADGRDRSLDYRISGFHVPPGTWDSQVRGCDEQSVRGGLACAAWAHVLMIEGCQGLPRI